MRECQPAELLNQAAVLPTSRKVVSSLFSTSFIISLTKATFVNERVNTRVRMHAVFNMHHICSMPYRATAII